MKHVKITTERIIVKMKLDKELEKVLLLDYIYWPQVRLFGDAQANSEGRLVSVGVSSSRGRTRLIVVSSTSHT